MTPPVLPILVPTPAVQSAPLPPRRIADMPPSLVLALRMADALGEDDCAEVLRLDLEAHASDDTTDDPTEA